MCLELNLFLKNEDFLFWGDLKKSVINLEGNFEIEILEYFGVLLL